MTTENQQESLPESSIQTDSTIELPFETSELRRLLEQFLNKIVDNPLNRNQQIKVGNFQWGVYSFYDYDNEPIYVGQTKEQLRTRIRRHLTNQRTDAVAMNVLDPFEVYKIVVYPEVQVDVPVSFEGVIVSDEVKRIREHPDIRIARRTQTISRLAQVISERKVPRGLRRVLHTQAKRLEWLAERRLESAAEVSDNDSD